MHLSEEQREMKAYNLGYKAGVQFLKNATVKQALTKGYYKRACDRAFKEVIKPLKDHREYRYEDFNDGFIDGWNDTQENIYIS